jgi:secernin
MAAGDAACGGIPSCDTMVALAARTATGATIFAKNSDRPGRESQPLFQAPRRRYPHQARVRCQYIEVPQSGETFAFIGSRPSWLWGLEHGLNEHGVAIGNEALITKDALPEVGLLGMDLVRLGLERAASARDAMELIGSLIERYGQGGSAARGFDWRYSNGFLIADHSEAWVLETSCSHWAARKVKDCASISNCASMTSPERGCADLREHARDRGWWNGSSRFDFAASYSEGAHPTSFSALGRLARSRELIAREGRRTVREMIGALRDHYEMGEMPLITAAPDSERRYSLCMHTDFICTTASMVADIPPPDSGDTPVMWASMAAPCTGIFLPLYVQGTIPSKLTLAEIEPSPDSPWWRMKSIQELVTQAPERLAPKVWRHFRPLEDEIFDQAEAIAKRVRGLDDAARAGLLTDFMRDNTTRALDAAARVEAELRVAVSASVAPLPKSAAVR